MLSTFIGDYTSWSNSGVLGEYVIKLSQCFTINLSYSFGNVGVSKALLYTYTGVFSHVPGLCGHVLTVLN